jgi:hypothetical protein
MTSSTARTCRALARSGGARQRGGSSPGDAANSRSRDFRRQVASAAPSKRTDASNEGTSGRYLQDKARVHVARVLDDGPRSYRVRHLAPNLPTRTIRTLSGQLKVADGVDTRARKSEVTKGQGCWRTR